MSALLAVSKIATQTDRKPLPGVLVMEPVAALVSDLEEASRALASFDVEKLDAIEGRIKALTAAQLASARGLLPQLLEKHAQLGQMLEVTAANLKVLVSVLQLETRAEMR